MALNILATNADEIALGSGGQPAHISGDLPVLADGSYTVTLTVTASNGSVAHSERIELVIGNLVPPPRPRPDPDPNPPTAVLVADPVGPSVS